MKCIKKTLSFLLICSLCSTTYLCGNKDDNKDDNNPDKKRPKYVWPWQRNSNNYTLSEEEARKKINNEIVKKFSRLYSAIAKIWPFNSQEKNDKVKIQNKEIREIKNISEKELLSTQNYKNILCREPFIRYVTKMIKQPVKKIEIEWREIKKQVPVTDFKEIMRKKYDEFSLKSNVCDKIVKLISNRSYQYAFDKTQNPVVADIVKKRITQELISDISSKRSSLNSYIGQEREEKIDSIIKEITEEENSKHNIITKENLSETTKGTFNTYPSQQCIVCKKRFSKVERVFLYPCGHDMCKQCFSQYNEKCPICRQVIEKGVSDSSKSPNP